MLFQILAQIHIPGDNYTAVEAEAENIAMGGGALAVSQVNSVVHPNTPQCPDGYHWDFSSNSCVACPSGYEWNGTSCALITCPAGYHYNGTYCVPDQITPPPQAADAQIPAGNIKVHDTQITNPVDGNLPVRKVRIVARRWFKIDRVFTDNAGYYQCNKRFRNKVRINVKFKNGDAVVRGMRGIRLWQMLFPIKKTLGVFSGDKSNISFTFLQFFNSLSAKGNRYWAGATAHNEVQEYRDYAVQEGIGLPTTGVKIILSNWGNGGGASPMFAKRFFNGLPSEFLFTFLAFTATPIAGGVTALVVVLKHQVDVAISYNVTSVTMLTSDAFKETVYHELTHTAHYSALGNGWYTNFVNAEISTIIGTFLSSQDHSPYGYSTGGEAPIIALGESWAYYIGHYLADKTYGLKSSQSGEQGINYVNNSPVTGLSSHLNLLEDFSPFRTADPFYWIPQDLFYDLRDTRNENLPVVDAVSGYTNTQMFNAFQSSITTLPNYRLRSFEVVQHLCQS